MGAIRLEVSRTVPHDCTNDVQPTRRIEPVCDPVRAPHPPYRRGRMLCRYSTTLRCTDIGR